MDTPPPSDLFSVLIVEDHLAAGRALAQVLRSRNAVVHLASSPEDAHRRALAQCPDVAVVGLEGIRGRQLLVEFAAMDSAPELIVHAEGPSSPAAEWARECGLAQVLEKPVEPLVLLERTLRLVQRRRNSGGAVHCAKEENAETESAPRSLELPYHLPALAEEAPLSSQWLDAAPPSSGTALVGKRGVFDSLPHLEEFVISDVFRECQGNLSMAARTLGIPRSTLRDRLRKYGFALPASRRQGSG